jgi:hypothetical protein
MDRVDPLYKFIHIYDVRRGGYIRKIDQESPDDDAFAIDTTAKLLAFATK